MGDDCWSSYARGVAHGLLLMLPVAAFLYRRWTQAAARASLKQPDDKDKQLGTNFLNELFAFEVVLVAGAELKAVRDQLKDAEQEGNAARVDALKQRVVDVASVLQGKLQTITPIIQFLVQQSVDCIKQYHSEAAATAESIIAEGAETKKDK